VVPSHATGDLVVGNILSDAFAEPIVHILAAFGPSSAGSSMTSRLLPVMSQNWSPTEPRASGGPVGVDLPLALVGDLSEEGTDLVGAPQRAMASA